MLQKFATQIDLRKAAALALVVGLAACGGGTTTTTDAGEGTETAASGEEAAGEKIFDSNVSLTGAGASFPAPLSCRLTTSPWVVAQALSNLQQKP